MRQSLAHGCGAFSLNIWLVNGIWHANTQRSYRDTLVLMVPFIAVRVRKQIDQLTVEDISAGQVRLFLQDLEQTRGCCVSTRNQRLAVVHALARFIAGRSPEHIEWCGTLGTIPFKRAMKREITYLEQSEMEALLAAPDRRTPQGQRDYALLLFLYNTGARADEAAQLTIGNLELAPTPARDLSSVQIHGKSNKLRRCPLWPHTASALTALLKDRAQHEHVFLNRCGRPITRFGIHTMVERYVKRVSTKLPALAIKRVSPHSLRHTTASHLLRAGVDNQHHPPGWAMFRLTPPISYAETDLEMKAKALATCEVKDTKRLRRWKEDKGLMTFLRAL
jgi:integrase/recombinase XerD